MSIKSASPQLGLATEAPIDVRAAPCDAFLANGGHTGALIRAYDWSATPLGRPETWPGPLKTAVSLMLGAAQPVYIAWGPELTSLYNDGYLSIVGAKHPDGLGKPFSELWAEIWEEFRPIIAVTMSGEAQHFVDMPIALAGRPGLPTGYFTFSYTPLRDEAGRVAGFYCAATETTQAVLVGQQAQAEIERLGQMFEQAPGFIAMVEGREHRVTLANIAYRTLIGGRDIVGKTVREALPELEGQGFFELLDRVYRTGEPFRATATSVRLARREDQPWEERVLDFVYQPVTDAQGQITGIFVEGSDVTESHKASEQLRESEERFRNMADHAPVMMWMSDATGTCTYANRVWSDFTGQSPEEAVGNGWRSVVHPDDLPAALRVMIAATEQREPRRVDYRLRRADGAWRWVIDASTPRFGPDGSYLGNIGSVIDITERKEAEQELEHLARHDSLTGLPNRSYFREQLDLRLKDEGSASRTALLFLDLDAFSSVNDALGHPAGDQLLRDAALRLQGCLRGVDLIARFGGDEFAILQNDVESRHDIEALAARLIGCLSEPYQLDEREVAIGASIGIAVPKDAGVDPDNLIQQADIALYKAKADGRSLFRFFDPSLEETAKKNQTLRSELREALAKGQFLLHYQPVVELGSLDVSAFEALLRWRHPGRGLVSPAEFIPLAEETGAIEEIGAWVLKEACSAAASWPDDITVSVNLSARQFRSGRLTEVVSDALASSGLAPGRLQLEITESMLLLDDEEVLRTLSELRALGVRLSIDDFGTGYSSLGYLRRFEVDNIKIDRSFVADLSENSKTAAILDAVLTLAERVGVSVTAEGIETKAQLEQLTIMRCQQGQGYLFSRPMPAEKVEWFIGRSKAAQKQRPQSA